MPFPTSFSYVRAQRLLAAVSLVALSSLTGCLSGSTDAVPISGVYQLQTINNSPLPYTFSNGIIVTSEVLTINTNGTFTDVTTQSTGAVVSDNGSYSNFGGTVNFSDQTALLVYQGYVTGTTLNTVIGGFSMVFTKTGPAPQ